MSIDVYVDRLDRMSTAGEVLGLGDRSRGIVTVQAAPAAFRAQLPRDVLVALGVDPDASDWPKVPQRRWPLARAWLAGFCITELIVYGAWRLTPQDVERLVQINADGVNVSCVTTRGLRRRLPVALRRLSPQPLEELLDRLAACPRTPAAPTQVAHVGTRVPPLPPADVFSFIPECIHTLRSGDDEREVMYVYRRSAADGDDYLRRRGCTREAVLDLLERSIRESTGGNDLLVRLRAAQCAAFGQGWLVDVPLRALGPIAALATDTAPSSHPDWPLPGASHPRLQAAAALAFAMGSVDLNLTTVSIRHVDSDAAQVAGVDIDEHLRPAIRALRHLRRHSEGAPDASPDDVYLFARTKGPPQAWALREQLGAFYPQALAAAATSGLRWRLDRLVSVSDIRERATPVVPESHRRAPGPVINDVEARFRQEWGISTGLTEDDRQLEHTALLSRAWSAGLGVESRDDSGPDRDPAVLHAVLLRAGGTADRRDLLRALDWGAHRLARARRRLSDRLAGTGESLTETALGTMEIRVRCDHKTTEAVERLQTRGSRDASLSPRAAYWLRRAIDGSRRGIGTDAFEDEHDWAAFDELWSRGLVGSGDYESFFQPTTDVRAAMGERTGRSSGYWAACE